LGQAYNHGTASMNAIDKESNGINASYSAFISYASENKEKAYEICQSLEQRGLRCWIAPRDVRPSKEYPAEIMRGIENSKCLVLLLSDAANSSIFVKKEVERAVSYRKPIFPIRLEEVMPSRQLELLVSATQWVDVWTGSMLDHIETLVGQMQEETDIEISPRQFTLAEKATRFYQRNTIFLVAMAALVAVSLIAVVSITSSKAPPFAGEEIKWKTIDNVTKEDISLKVTVDDYQANIVYFTLHANPSYSPFSKQDISETLVNMKYEASINGGEYTLLKHIGAPTAQVRFQSKETKTAVDIIVRDKNDVKAGPFNFNFDISDEIESALSRKDTELQRKEEVIKAKVQEATIENMRQNDQQGIITCEIQENTYNQCEMGMGVYHYDLSNIIETIEIVSNENNWSKNINFSSDLEKQEVLYLPPMSEGHPHNWLFSAPFDFTLSKYRARFRDGTYTDFKTINPQRDVSFIRKKFPLPKNDASAPQVYMSLTYMSNNMLPANGKWTFFPWVDSATKIEWSLQGEAWNTIQSWPGKFPHITLGGSSFGLSSNQPYPSNEKILFRYHFSDGEIREYSYSVAKVLLASIEEYISKNSEISYLNPRIIKFIHIPFNSFDMHDSVRDTYWLEKNTATVANL